MRKFLSVCTLLLLPSLVLAAGFAKQSLFLSESTVTQGDTVDIYAVVDDETPYAFSGKLQFSDDIGPIGDAAVKLNPGGATTVSVSWKPTAGNRTVTAELITPQGDIVESESEIFTINPKPTTSLSSDSATESTGSGGASTAVEPSTPIEQQVIKIFPAATKSVQTTFSAIDSGRSAAAGALNQGMNWSKQKIVEVSNSAQGGLVNMFWVAFATAVLYVFAALSYIISHVGVFYPVLALLFIYLLLRLYRRSRDIVRR